MPRYNNVKAPNPNPGWFAWLPRKVQCFLILLLTVPITALLFLAALHCVHTGKPMVLNPKTTVDSVELFFSSAVGLVISGIVFAVMMGWARSPTAHVSETHQPRLPK